MTEFVIDANVLMSILISGKAAYRPILSFNTFILPDFALVEIEKYNTTLQSKTAMPAPQLVEWTYFVFSELTILPRYVLDEHNIATAARLLEKIDMKDLSYLALAMQLERPLLTRDAPLCQGLRKQGLKNVIMFDDFLRAL
jgi:predicted nucleic acid-binding protein